MFTKEKQDRTKNGDKRKQGSQAGLSCLQSKIEKRTNTTLTLRIKLWKNKTAYKLSRSKWPNIWAKQQQIATLTSSKKKRKYHRPKHMDNNMYRDKCMPHDKQQLKTFKRLKKGDTSNQANMGIVSWSLTVQIHHGARLAALKVLICRYLRSAAGLGGGGVCKNIVYVHTLHANWSVTLLNQKNPTNTTEIFILLWSHISRSGIAFFDRAWA